MAEADLATGEPREGRQALADQGLDELLVGRTRAVEELHQHPRRLDHEELLAPDLQAEPPHGLLVFFQVGARVRPRVIPVAWRIGARVGRRAVRGRLGVRIGRRTVPIVLGRGGLALGEPFSHLADGPRPRRGEELCFVLGLGMSREELGHAPKQCSFDERPADRRQPGPAGGSQPARQRSGLARPAGVVLAALEHVRSERREPELVMPPALGHPVERLPDAQAEPARTPTEARQFLIDRFEPPGRGHPGSKRIRHRRTQHHRSHSSTTPRSNLRSKTTTHDRFLHGRDRDSDRLLGQSDPPSRRHRSRPPTWTL
jgi:hypothetical protein